MNRRVRKKRIGYWAFVREFGNMGIIAVCQSCGYSYYCSTCNDNFKVVIKKPHNYCPECGRKMKLFDEYKVYKLDKEGYVTDELANPKSYTTWQQEEKQK